MLQIYHKFDCFRLKHHNGKTAKLPKLVLLYKEYPNQKDHICDFVLYVNSFPYKEIFLQFHMIIISEIMVASLLKFFHLPIKFIVRIIFQSWGEGIFLLNDIK